MIPEKCTVKIICNKGLILGTNDHGDVVVNKAGSEKGQFWNLIPLEDGGYIIQNAETKRDLCFKRNARLWRGYTSCNGIGYDGNAYYDSNTYVWLPNLDPQRWHIEKSPDGMFVLRPYDDLKWALRPDEEVANSECRLTVGKSSITRWKIEKVKDLTENKPPVGFDHKDNSIFRTVVVATMSTGKSTLINALAGKELLPSLNQACTARTVALLDNDQVHSPKCSILYRNGQVKKDIPCTINDIQAFNQDKNQDIKDILVECNIEGVHNIGRSLMLIDTPGVNNNLDENHAKVTKDYIEAMDTGLLLYMMNANQPATYDDAEFLSWILEQQKKKNGLKVIFVLNKIDEIDPESESAEEMISVLVDYIKQNGFEMPVLLPVSSKAALLFKKALSHQKLTETETDEFYKYYKKFSKKTEASMDCRSLFWNEKIRNKENVHIDEKEYLCMDLYKALEQTGIPMLEHWIEKELLLSCAANTPAQEQ